MDQITRDRVEYVEHCLHRLYMGEVVCKADGSLHEKYIENGNYNRGLVVSKEED